MSLARRVSGLAIPSLNPIRLRGVPAGRGGLEKPSMRHSGCITPRVCRVRSRSACSTVSVLPALSCTLRSPPHCAGSRSSLGKVRIAVSPAGLRAASPYRSSNREAPTPTVIVSPSGTTVGPSTPESAGGAPIPSGGGVPPAVRKRARSVSVASRPASSARLAAVTVKAVTMVRRAGLARMPGWCGPWNGTAGSTPAQPSPASPGPPGADSAAPAA